MEELSAAAPPRSAAGRFAQVALAALLTLGSLAYSVGLTRAAGLVLFPEQFLAAIYGVCLALLFISFPAARGTPREIPWYDWLFAAAGLAVGLYVAMTFPRLTAQAGTVTFELLFLAAVLAFLTLEGTRRTSGYSLIIITFVLVVWVLIGHLVPGQLQTHKVEAKTLAIYLSFDNNGLLGLVLEIACTIVVAFVLMGQLLARSGKEAGDHGEAMGDGGRARRAETQGRPLAGETVESLRPRPLALDGPQGVREMLLHERHLGLDRREPLTPEDVARRRRCL